MRSVPSTWTSAREKFLNTLALVPKSHARKRLTWSDSRDQQGCKQHQSDERWLRWKLCCVDRIPAPRVSHVAQWQDECEVLTMNTTRPRSPVTLRWRLVISSRKGTTTVHPCRADIISLPSLSHRHYPFAIPSLFTMYRPS